MSAGISIPAAPDVVDGPETEVPIEVTGGPLTLEVTIFKTGERGREDGLLGRWTFEGVPTGGSSLNILWSDPGPGGVRITQPGGEPFAASSALRSPDALVWPCMTVSLRSGGEERALELKVVDAGLLKDYYRREDHQQEYVVQHPFFEAFHQGRLRCLERVFRKHIEPGGRVLDVGSGYGIFYMISDRWDLDITCCDLDAAAMDKMRGLAPDWNWVVADALDLPWDDRSFDAVYAGEIIEHVSRPEDALSEWTRVLAPGGTLVISTPNRDRLLARARGEIIPVHHEHIAEMNLGELRRLVRSGGFDVTAVTGVYLEVLINWWRPADGRVDLLTARLGHPRYRALYRAAMELGRAAPSAAFDLVMACRKRAGGRGRA